LSTADGAGAEQDRVLVRSVLDRREGAFETLVEGHQRLVWYMVYRLLKHDEDTRDVCQEAFLRVHRDLHRFRFESRLSTWIARIAWHAALRHLERKRLPQVALDAEDGIPADALASDLDLEADCDSVQLLERVHRAIDALSPLKRAVVTLFYLEDLEVSEIAVIVNRPEGTVKSELLRARVRIRQMIALPEDRHE
jgi:RNA polymerase sigma factor (sigma-70 family)